MAVKKVVLGLLCSAFVIGLGVYYFSTTRVLHEFEASNTKTEISKNSHITYSPVVPKSDLYLDSVYEMPLMAIYEISKLPKEMKKNIDELFEASQGFFILKNMGDKVLILLQNPIIEANVYPRHNLQYVEVFNDGKKVFHNAGYSGIDGEISESLSSTNGEWTLDKSIEPYRPIEHNFYDEKKKVKFTERWSINLEEDVKYQMLNSSGDVISIMKETQENDSSYRREHIFYNMDNSIAISLSISYIGANISSVRYYNSHSSIDSISIVIFTSI